MAQNTNWTTPGHADANKDNWPGIVQGNIQEVRDMVVRARRVVTAPTTLADTDDAIIFNSTGPITQALPAANSVTAWRRFQLNNINTGLVTISSTLSGSINREMPQWGAYTVMSTGSQWVIV